MCFQMLPKLSVASNLVYSSRQTVPHTRSCDSKDSVAERGTCAWNGEFAAVAHAGTDRQTPDRCTDPAAHTMRAVPEAVVMNTLTI